MREAVHTCVFSKEAPSYAYRPWRIAKQTLYVYTCMYAYVYMREYLHGSSHALHVFGDLHDDVQMYKNVIIRISSVMLFIFETQILTSFMLYISQHSTSKEDVSMAQICGRKRIDLSNQ